MGLALTANARIVQTTPGTDVLSGLDCRPTGGAPEGVIDTPTRDQRHMTELLRKLAVAGAAVAALSVAACNKPAEKAPEAAAEATNAAAAADTAQSAAATAADAAADASKAAGDAATSAAAAPPADAGAMATTAPATPATPPEKH